MKKTKMTQIASVLGIIAIAAIIGFGLSACGDGGGHTHMYSWSWSYNETQHWRECEVEGCDAKIEIENHTETHGYCGYCDYSDHTYSTTWSSDEMMHWKNCTFAGCDSRDESAYHNPGNGICLTCGNDGHSHFYHRSEWSSDETQHWKVCGFQDCEEKSEIADHTIAHDRCTICGYGHTYSSEWSSNATQHWKECTDADCDAKTDIADHTLVHDSLCTTCGYGVLTHICTAERQNDVRSGVNAKTCTYNGCDELSDIELTLSIGDNGPAGGKIFYVADGLEKRTLGFTVTGAGSFTAYYLEAAPYNQDTWLRWASTNINVTGATGTAIGTGRANTAAIIAAHSGDNVYNNAAKKAAEYNGGDKDDWFLPSIDELNEMYQARSHLGISSGNFWSSSQSSISGALYWEFDNGRWIGNVKSIPCIVRAVRAF